MRVNAVKQALKAGQLQLGCGFWQLKSVEVPRILAAAGFKWTFIDAEHGNFDFETIQDVCRASVVSGLCPIVRVADLQYSLIARSLDCGAQGVLFPRVESAELLAKAISWTKFPPLGVRGFGLGPPQADYENVSLKQMVDHLNEQTMVVIQIETRKAVEMREELLAVAGVDVVMVGPADLSISLGVPGDFTHPSMVQAIESVRDTCVKRGIAPGIHTRSPDLAKFWRDRGMKFLGCENEVAMLLERAQQIVKEVTG